MQIRAKRKERRKKNDCRHSPRGAAVEFEAGIAAARVGAKTRNAGRRNNRPQ
jgi:hypothetical protein